MSPIAKMIYAQLIALGLLCVGLTAGSASAAEFPYTLEPQLSLTGDCSTSALDPVPDPDCPYPAPPAGPTGRFNKPPGVAIDSYGNVYVASFENGRIDVFDDQGKFITEFADPNAARALAVDRKGNLYAFERITGTIGGVVRYSPTVYEPEEGEIAYGNPRVVLDEDPSTSQGSVAVDPSNDRVYASWWGNFITEYGAAAEGNNLLETITPAGLRANNWVAVDGQTRRLFVSTATNSDGFTDAAVLVLEADAPHGVLAKIDGSEVPLGEFLAASGRLGLAVDEETGHLFVGDTAQGKSIYEFSEDYQYLSKVDVPKAQTASPQIAVSNSALNKGAANHRYLFSALFEASGSVLAFEPPEIRAPEVEELTTTNIGETEAELRATIDPGVDSEAEPTEYAIEYEVSGSGEPQLATSGTIPSSAPPRQVSTFLTGLSPETEYRFRVLAENGAGEDEGESSFATFSDAPITPDPQCPNGALRSGASAALPDCRVYELVTPPDTNGSPVKGAWLEGDRFPAPQSSPAGDAVNFTLLAGVLPGTEGTGGFYGDVYRTTRASDGWSTVLDGPNGSQASKPQHGSFSPDQRFHFWLAAGEGSAVVGGNATRYLGYPDGHFELVGRGSIGTDPGATGKLITSDATHVVFETTTLVGAPQKLEPDAPPTGTTAVYDRTRDPISGEEQTHVVSLLPPPSEPTPSAGQNASYLGASADGNGIAFKIGSTTYLRVDNATTYEIGTGVTFAGVSADGTRIFYVEAGDLYAFDAGTETAIRFSEVGDAVPINVAPGGTRAYFVSEVAIPTSGLNPNGDSPQPAGQNLYLSTEGSISFVGTVTDRDVEGEANGALAPVEGLGLWSEAIEEQRPGLDPSRLTPEGSVLLFHSRANLDGYESGGDPQIYRYDQVANRLECISCPPTKTAGGEGAVLQSFYSLDPVAPSLDRSAPFADSGFIQSLRADARRAFFESSEALVSTDTDGKHDVYQWEEEGEGSCKREGGCIYLISPGDSPTDEYLFGHSTSGNDVFFTSNDILVSEDQDTLSVYDARVGGGFAPNEPAGECLGGACQPTASAPDDPSPASVAFRGQGNVKPAGAKPRCPKGRRQVKRGNKSRCAKKRAQKRHRNQSTGKGGHK